MGTKDYIITYIKNYVRHSKTGGAIMLTSSWGRGKSFFIENSLIKALKDTAECIKISLYGIKSLEDISKAIYFEAKANKKDKKHKKRHRKDQFSTRATLAGRAILRGILGYYKINLSFKGNELQELYESIDLSKKLLIFEDVERSSISIVDIMGYVNNLCEQDNLKVLLVANEKIILSRDKKDRDEYLKIKEKTVSDTIIFECDIKEPIGSILGIFANAKENQENEISDFFHPQNLNTREELVKTISEIMSEDAECNEGNGYNLRSLIFACQKTEDLFREAKKNNCNFTPEFFKACLLGIIAFSLKFKRGDCQQGNDCLRWDSDLLSPAKLGNGKYPLLKVCYCFVKEQKFNCEDFCREVEDYSQIKNKEWCWRRIRHFTHYSFKELSEAIEKFYEFIQEGKVPLEDYGTLVKQLFLVEDRLGKIDLIDSVLEMVKEKLQSEDFQPYEIYEKLVKSLVDDLRKDEMKQKCKAFKEESVNIIHQRAVQELIALTTTKEGIREFRNKCAAYGSSNELFQSLSVDFLLALDVEKLAELLTKCSPKNIPDFAEVFCNIYKNNKCFSGSASSVVEVADKLDEFINRLIEKVEDSEIDKVIKYNIELFIEDLRGLKPKK